MIRFTEHLKTSPLDPVSLLHRKVADIPYAECLAKGLLALWSHDQPRADPVFRPFQKLDLQRRILWALRVFVVGFQPSVRPQEVDQFTGRRLVKESMGVDCLALV